MSWNVLVIMNWIGVSVSLFVRLWVEIFNSFLAVCPSSSASSWGCELKYFKIFKSLSVICQPLREAVSWNMIIPTIPRSDRLSASSWGCELKYTSLDYHVFIGVSLFVRLWVEITDKDRKECIIYVSLFVRLWVEISKPGCYLYLYYRQPLREAVSWNIL